MEIHFLVMDKSWKIIVEKNGHPEPSKVVVIWPCNGSHKVCCTWSCPASAWLASSVMHVTRWYYGLSTFVRYCRTALRQELIMVGPGMVCDNIVGSRNSVSLCSGPLSPPCLEGRVYVCVCVCVCVHLHSYSCEDTFMLECGVARLWEVARCNFLLPRN